MKNECYSLDGVNFYGEIEEILAIAEVDFVDELGLFYVGEDVEVNHSDYIFASDLISEMQDRVYEECGELAEGYISDLDICLKLHRTGLEKVISDYMDEHFAKPSFFKVTNVRQMTPEQFETRQTEGD